MTEYQRQLNIDYLRRPQDATSEPTHEEPTSPFFNDALMLYGRRVIESLAHAKDRTMTLHTVIDELSIPIDTALMVAEYLNRKKYLTIVQRDLKGNHKLQLTSEGFKLLR